MFAEYSEDIYPYATFQLEESVPAGGDSRCNSAAPLQTFVYHDPRLSTADTLQLREVSSADVYHRSRAFAPLIRARLRYPHVFFVLFFLSSREIRDDLVLLSLISASLALLSQERGKVSLEFAVQSSTLIGSICQSKNWKAERENP